MPPARSQPQDRLWRVESAGFGKLSAKQFRQLLDDAGLVCPRLT
jgi:hypothetical protein